LKLNLVQLVLFPIFSFTIHSCCFSLFYITFRDNVPTIILNSWDVVADLLDDDFLDGVMPVLFAEEGLVTNLDTTRKDLERLARVYFVPELRPW
jgi:hypothetical protein